MEKAYDLKGLMEEVKGKGLSIAEEGAEQLFDAVMIWLEKSADLSESPYDDMLKLLYPQVKDLVKKQIDKIDKSDNE